VNLEAQLQDGRVDNLQRSAIMPAQALKKLTTGQVSHFYIPSYEQCTDSGYRMASAHSSFSANASTSITATGPVAPRA
jgi:hypothetical protein